MPAAYSITLAAIVAGLFLAVAVGVTMYNGGPLWVHLAAIFVAVVWLAVVIVALVIPPWRRPGTASVAASTTTA